MSSSIQQCLLLLISFFSLSSAHIVMTYPGWRGNNLATNGTVQETNGLAVQGDMHPYGMQWEYPCGGMPMSTNRTKWPVHGGAVALQPGWFTGHSLTTLFINLGEGTYPKNYSLPMVGNIAIQGPTNDAYPGLEVCFPQVPTPANLSPKIGDNATIQVIMLAQHGAALYSLSLNIMPGNQALTCSQCVDITFADPSEVLEITKDNCRNDTQPGNMTFQQIYQTSNLQGAASTLSSSMLYTFAPLAVAFATAILL